MVRETGRARSNGFKLDKLRFNRDIGKYWFTNRVVDERNRLSSHVVRDNTINTLKNMRDKFTDWDIR